MIGHMIEDHEEMITTVVEIVLLEDIRRNYRL